MVEAAYYIGLKRACLFLHADKVEPGHAKEIALADVNRARAYLLDVAQIENVQLPEGLKGATSVVAMMKAAYLIGQKKSDVLERINPGNISDDAAKTRQFLELLSRRNNLQLYEDIAVMIDSLVAFHRSGKAQGR